MIFNLGAKYLQTNTKTQISYTGNYTETEIVSNGVKCTLYTLTGSGILEIKGKKPVSVWMCGGGNDGVTEKGGGAGAFAASLTDTVLKGSYVVSIGAANGASSLVKDGETVLSVSPTNGVNGGTGGGGMYLNSAGVGDGIPKYPFGDNVNFKCHCPGGGSGVYEDTVTALFTYHGANGGSNGSSGSKAIKAVGTAEIQKPNIGIGGEYGGGNGGGKLNYQPQVGTSGGFYGAGGGQNAYFVGKSPSSNLNGSGYQGVMYILKPAA